MQRHCLRFSSGPASMSTMQRPCSRCGMAFQSLRTSRKNSVGPVSKLPSSEAWDGLIARTEVESTLPAFNGARAANRMEAANYSGLLPSKRRPELGDGCFQLSAARALESAQIVTRLIGLNCYENHIRSAFCARRPDDRIRCRGSRDAAGRTSLCPPLRRRKRAAQCRKSGANRKTFALSEVY